MQDLTVSNYTVEDSGISILTGGDAVIVNPGFEAKAGSYADLNIVPCTVNVCTPPSFKTEPRNASVTNSNPPVQIDSFTFLVYPNPASENIIIDLGNGFIKGATVNIFNQQGETVGNIKDVEAAKFEINVVSYATGLYLISYKDEKHYVTQKLTIIR